MPPRSRILIVDDDPPMRLLFEKLLGQADYECVSVVDAEEALSRIASGPFDILLADINLPGLSGLELLRHVREREYAGEVILVTAFASVDSAIQALREGAFDYLVKPVHKETLLESIGRAEEKVVVSRQRREALVMLEAGLRQFTGDPTPALPQGIKAALARGGTFRVGPVVLDLDRFVVEVGGRPVEATPTEVEILHFFCRHPDRVVTPQELIQAIRGYTVEAWEAREMIRPHISNLRRKLLAASPEADIIVTIRTVGYMLRSGE